MAASDVALADSAQVTWQVLPGQGGLFVQVFMALRVCSLPFVVCWWAFVHLFEHYSSFSRSLTIILRFSSLSNILGEEPCCGSGSSATP